LRKKAKIAKEKTYMAKNQDQSNARVAALYEMMKKQQQS
jgi:hypothetical protein